jgi:hypothetical protein
MGFSGIYIFFGISVVYETFKKRYPDIWGSPFGDLYNWGFIIWGLGKNSFGDWKINIRGFVHLGI